MPDAGETNIEALLLRIRQNGHDVWIAGSQSEEAVVALELALQVRLSPSYRQFLLRYGAMSIYDSCIAGIVDNQPLYESGSSIYSTTMYFRQERGVPDHLIIVEPDEEAPYCFDTRHVDAAGESPLNCYELYSGADGKIADNFQEFIVKWFLETWTEEEA